MISVVSGTLNRLPHLQRMVESVRQSAGSIPYEIILVDGGSTDGTQAWASEQDDVFLIEHGKRLGAIKAFNDGFDRAAGAVIVVMNDDARLVGDTLVRAYTYLSENPRCGQVSFQNISKTRPAYDGWEGYPYGQCCMTRTWLLRLAGGWGLDATQGGYYFYAGDTQLGCRVWELGYTVDRVPRCGVEDDVLEDTTRASAPTFNDSGLFKANWERRLPPKHAWRPAPDRSHLLELAAAKELRVVRLKITPPGAQMRHGMKDAFDRIGSCTQFSYDEHLGFSTLVEYARRFQPHIMIFQEQGQGLMPVRYLDQLREAAPGIVLLNFNGDVRIPVQKSAVDFADACDGALVASPDLFKYYRAPYYWVKSAEDEYYAVKRAKKPEAVITFMGNLNYSFPGAKEREALFAHLRDAGLRLEIYGRGFGGHEPTDEQHALNAGIYARSLLGLSISNFNNLYGYTSDRLYLMLASGVPTLVKRFPGMEAHGLVHGHNCIIFDTPQEAAEHALFYMNHGKEREAIGRYGRRLMQSTHSWDARVADLLQLLQVNAPAGLSGTAPYIATFRASHAAAAPAVAPPVTGDQSLVTLTYLGTSSLRIPYDGPVTKTRYFASTKQRQIYVDARDADGLRAERKNGKAVFQ